ncbi:TIGR02453 family protein [Nocardia sp. R6R-6]|uniref:TIGR02453 family protein n=1 Tax=Nocardia sp. R6R-6 TaxID=3459303 RepID=UPI00403D7B84
MTGFAGFPLAGLDFYEDLEADNSKAFWTANKEIYDRAVKQPMTALIAELEPAFGSAKIFRPYRDLRFAKDKSPYKTAQGAVVRAAPGVGWYVQINAGGLLVGGGFYQASPGQLEQLRATIDDDVRGTELVTILAKLTRVGFTVGGEKLKTRPKGYDDDHPRIDLLRHKSLSCSKDFGAPAWLETPQAAKEVRATWEAMRPLVEWLAAVVGGAPS